MEVILSIQNLFVTFNKQSQHVFPDHDLTNILATSLEVFSATNGLVNNPARLAVPQIKIDRV